MSETSKHPFDTDRLIKGDEVPVLEIERAYSVKYPSPDYQFAWMHCKEFVIRRFAERGEVVTVVQRDGALLILTDEQQVDYNIDQFKQGIRKARRAHSRMLGADRSMINNQKSLESHDRRLEVQGRVLSAVAKETRIVRPLPVKRATPVLPEKTKP